VTTLLQAPVEFALVLVNGALELDAVARARLEKLDGRSIEFRTASGADVLRLRITGARLDVDASPADAPTVLVRGAPGNVVEAFLRGRFRDANCTIEGDETTLSELADVLRSVRPDFEAPLGRLIGETAAQNVVGLFELGAETLARFAREVGDQGGFALRSAAARKFLDRADFDAFLARRHALALAADRIAARIDALERAQS